MINDGTVTIIAALIGAVIGSVGTSFINDWLKRKGEKMSLEQSLTHQYLLQLQDAIESLWFRFDNIKNKGGRLIMQNIYYEESTLYALGCVLAYNRIFLLDGIISQLERLEPGFGILIKEKFQVIDSNIDHLQFFVQFYHYDRLALAETIIKRLDNHLGICTYLEFKEKYEDSNSHIKESLKPAIEFVSSLTGPDVSGIMNELESISLKISEKTNIKSNIVRI